MHKKQVRWLHDDIRRGSTELTAPLSNLQRKVIVPAFSREHIRNLTPLFMEHAYEVSGQVFLRACTYSLTVPSSVVCSSRTRCSHSSRTTSRRGLTFSTGSAAARWTSSAVPVSCKLSGFDWLPVADAAARDLLQASTTTSMPSSTTMTNCLTPSSRCSPLGPTSTCSSSYSRTFPGSRSSYVLK